MRYLPFLKPQGVLGWLTRMLRNLKVGLSDSRTHLYLTSALFELAGNLVFVSLVEKAFELGDGATSIGYVLIIQAATQVLLSTWVGGFINRFGIEKAYTLGLFSLVLFAFGIIWSPGIEIVYLLSFLIMVSRLVVITTRAAIITRVTARTKLVQVNSYISILVGAGQFVGPGLAAWVMFMTDGSKLVSFIAGLGLILAALISLSDVRPPEKHEIYPAVSFYEQIRIARGFIAKHRPVWQVLMCLVISVMILGAIYPLITPLSRQAGLGSEGTGLFFSAIGLGALLGPLTVSRLLKIFRFRTALLLVGALLPLAILAVGFVEDVPMILAVLLVAALANASLGVLVTTILQRLTPLKMQGFVFGSWQALIGFAWIISLMVVTTLISASFIDMNLQTLFRWIGFVGLLLISSCLMVGLNQEKQESMLSEVPRKILSSLFPGQSSYLLHIWPRPQRR